MRSDVHHLLIRLLLARGGDRSRLIGSSETPWASITFEGARHVIELALPQGDAGPFVSGIEEAEFALRSHLLADIAVGVGPADADGLTRLRVEALTLVVR